MDDRHGRVQEDAEQRRQVAGVIDRHLDQVPDSILALSQSVEVAGPGTILSRRPSPIRHVTGHRKRMPDDDRPT